MDLVRFRIKCPICGYKRTYMPEWGILDEISEGEPRFPWEINYECRRCNNKMSISEYEVYIKKIVSQSYERGYIRGDDYDMWFEDREGNQYDQSGSKRA